MRILKKSFNALVQYSFEKAMLKNGDNFSQIKNVTLNLRKETTSANLEAFLQHFSFEVLVAKILDDKKDIQSKMVVAYLKDISSLLASVAVVREGDFQLHMEAERDMLKYCFAFDHINYARYTSIQHVYLSDLEAKGDPAIDNLIKRSIAGSLSGDKFSSIHGDLITEVFNGETKRQAGPHRSGLSTNVDAVNTWIKTTHIHAKSRKKFSDTIRLTTDSHHKETTQSEMKRHSQHVKNLKDQLKRYNNDLFGDGPVKQLTTGKITDAKIMQGLLDAEKIGNSKYLGFVAERLVKGTKKFFDPIIKTNLDTGIKRKPQANKVSAIKEDRQRLE